MMIRGTDQSTCAGQARRATGRTRSSCTPRGSCCGSSSLGTAASENPRCGLPTHRRARLAFATDSSAHCHFVQDRSIVIKANRLLADFCTSKAEALGLPAHMVVRAREAADSFTADATAAGMLNKAEGAKMKPPKLVVRGRQQHPFPPRHSGCALLATSMLAPPLPTPRACQCARSHRAEILRKLRNLLNPRL